MQNLEFGRLTPERGEPPGGFAEVTIGALRRQEHNNFRDRHECPSSTTAVTLISSEDLVDARIQAQQRCEQSNEGCHPNDAGEHRISGVDVRFNIVRRDDLDSNDLDGTGRSHATKINAVARVQCRPATGFAVVLDSAVGFDFIRG